MASAVLTFHNGKLDTEDDLATSLNLKEGQRLIVVASGPDEIVLQREVLNSTAMRKQADALHGYQPDWRNLRGILSHLSRSPNEMLEEERLRELELDPRP